MCLLSRANSLKSVMPGMLDCLSVNIGYAFVKKLVNRAVIVFSRPESLTDSLFYYFNVPCSLR